MKWEPKPSVFDAVADALTHWLWSGGEPPSMSFSMVLSSRQYDQFKAFVLAHKEELEQLK